MLNPTINSFKLLEEEYNLYVKHLILDEIGLLGQLRLKSSKVLIIGAGGIGCPALLYLAASGIGYLGVIDNDCIDKSNLTRQILYSHEDLNCNKNEIAKFRLNKINPYIKIITHKYKLDQNNASEIIQYYDIIIDACDNYETRYIISKTCYKLHKICVYGAVQTFESQFSILNYKSGHTYTDIYPQDLILFNRKCNNEGILGIITGSIGILQASETLKIILGFDNSNRNRIVINHSIKAYTKAINIYKIRKYNKTTNYNKFKHILLMPPTNEKILFKDKINIILDIRSKSEFQNYHNRYSINIPLNQLKQYKSIKYIFNNYKQKVIIIACSTQYRALIAQYILKQYNLKYYIKIREINTLI